MEELYYKDREYLLQDRAYNTGVYNTLFGNILSFMNTPPHDKTLGTDVSKWNGNSDFIKMHSKGMRFGIAKATDVGWGSKKPFIDEKAVYNYTSMGHAKMLRGFYCWLDPNSYSNPIEQANFYVDFYLKYPTEIPPVLDFEDHDVISYDNMLWRAQTWLEIVEEKTGKTPIVYTSPGYMMAFNKAKTGFLKKYPLWVAHYIQRSYPTLPYPWDNYLIWQYSDRGHYPYYIHPATTFHGREWGSGSGYLDMNWWNDTYEGMLAFCEQDNDTQPLPPVVPSEPLFKAQCVAGILNVRVGPSTLNPIVRTIKSGDIVNVYRVENSWFKINGLREEWVSGHPNYMKKLTEEPVEPEDPIIPTEPLKKLYYPCDERWRITQYFGERPHVYTQSRGHNGIDFGIPVGNPIYSAWEGVVEIAEKRTYGYGAVVYLRHSHGITIYGHLSRIDVKVGDKVKAKQIIGLSGGATSDPYSGYSTGPHLHFEYRWDITAPQVPGGFTYNAVDPLPLLITHEEGDLLFRIRVKVGALNVRSGPATTFNVLHSIKQGETHNVYEEKDGWVRIGVGRWCSGHETYVEKLDQTEDPSTPILFRAKCIVGALNVRNSAGTDGKILWQLRENDIVNIYETKNNWYRIHESEQQWCSGNTSYMRRI